MRVSNRCTYHQVPIAMETATNDESASEAGGFSFEEDLAYVMEMHCEDWLLDIVRPSKLVSHMCSLLCSRFSFSLVFLCMTITIVQNEDEGIIDEVHSDESDAEDDDDEETGTENTHTDPAGLILSRHHVPTMATPRSCVQFATCCSTFDLHCKGNISNGSNNTNNNINNIATDKNTNNNTTNNNNKQQQQQRQQQEEQQQ